MCNPLNGFSSLLGGAGDQASIKDTEGYVGGAVRNKLEGPGNFGVGDRNVDDVFRTKMTITRETAQ